MKTKVVRIDSSPAGPASNRNFNKTHKPLLYIIYLLALLSPLADAGASPETDFSDWMAKASAGDAASQQKVGDAYCKGVGVKQNFAEAFAWLSKASEQNDIQAQKDIAHLFSKGLGVVKDETAAFNWYMKAAQLNDPEAMRMVAVRYQTGLGVDVNNEKSVEWLQRSADQGNFEAQSSLGFAYLMGIGVSKDYEQALALFLGSAGVAQSRFYISNFYTHGWVGAKDKIKAYMWCLLATEMDSENTQYAEELAKLKSGLTATRLAQATKAAAEQKQLWAERKLQFQGPTISYLNKKNARLPFRLESGMIIVPLQVSGLGEVNFLVDTGSPGSVLAQRVAKKIKLKSNDYAAAGGIGPKISLARLAHDITLSTPELAFKKVSLFLFPDFDIDEIVGLPIGGVLGMDIMRHAVVAINYKEKIITLTSPDSFQLEPGFTKIPLRVAWNKP